MARKNNKNAAPAPQCCEHCSKREIPFVYDSTPLPMPDHVIDTGYEKDGMRLFYTQDLLKSYNGFVSARRTFTNPETFREEPFPNTENHKPHRKEYNPIDKNLIPFVEAKEVLLECTDGFVYISKVIANRCKTLKDLLSNVPNFESPIPLQRVDVESMTQIARFYFRNYYAPEYENGEKIPNDGERRPKLIETFDLQPDGTRKYFNEAPGNTDPMKKIYLYPELHEKLHVRFSRPFFTKIIEMARKDGETFGSYGYSKTWRYHDAADFVGAEEFRIFCKHLVGRYFDFIVSHPSPANEKRKVEEIRIAMDHRDGMSLDNFSYEHLMKNKMLYGWYSDSNN